MNALYVRTTKYPLQVVQARLEKIVAAHRFGILGIIDLKEKMLSKGIQLKPNCRIYEVCQPAKAKQALDRNMSIATALPCRIAVYEDGGTLNVAAMLPSQILQMFDAPDLSALGQEMDKEITAIVDETVV